MLETIKIMLEDYAYRPVRAHDADAGLDLRTPEAFTIAAGGQAMIETGVHVEIPSGYYGKLESKSGLNVKHSIVSLGGTIDSGYTGIVMVKLYNLGDQDYRFEAGDKVVQLIIQPCETPKIEFVGSLGSTERGDGGFGSSGR